MYQKSRKEAQHPQIFQKLIAFTGYMLCFVNVGLLQDDGGAGGGLQLGFVAGVILRERLPAFEKMLWRACRGNVFLRVADIEDPLEDPHTGDEVIKSVFVIFFQG